MMRSEDRIPIKLPRARRRALNHIGCPDRRLDRISITPVVLLLPKLSMVAVRRVSGGEGRGAISLLPRHDGPGDARHLIGDGDRD